MSRTLLESGPLGVGIFAGTATTPPSPRRRWQFTVRDGTNVAVLTDAEVLTLIRVLCYDVREEAAAAAAHLEGVTPIS